MDSSKDKKSSSLLNLLESQRKQISYSKLKKFNNPAGILKLVEKCESLISQLDESDLEIVNELLLTITRLKIILYHLFKRKQQKLTELHWEQLQKKYKLQ